DGVFRVLGDFVALCWRNFVERQHVGSFDAELLAGQPDAPSITVNLRRVRGMAQALAFAARRVVEASRRPSSEVLYHAHFRAGLRPRRSQGVLEVDVRSFGRGKVRLPHEHTGSGQVGMHTRVAGPADAWPRPEQPPSDDGTGCDPADACGALCSADLG